MGRNSDLAARRAKVMPRGIGCFHETATAEHAAGAVITDLEGRELIDLIGGIGVMNVGHSSDAVVQAIREQAGKLQHTCIHVATYEPYVALCEKLAAMFPHGEASKVMLVNTGAEAVENAVKIARQFTGRSEVICFTEAFHGRTMLALTLTSKVGYKRHCGPFAAGVQRLPYPSHFRYGDGLSLEAFVDRELTRLRQALVNMAPADEVAAVIIEPVQGEGGFVEAPIDYLRGLREICTEHGIMLIVDEVQSGFGRTGKWAAYQHAEITPDLSTWAKSLGGGLPIGAVIGRAEVMDAALPGTLGGTYGGNPIACAAALAAIDEMKRLRLDERAASLGARIRERFSAIHNRFPEIVGDVRGVGCMMAIEFLYGGDLAAPATEVASAVLRGCLKKGVLMLNAGAHGNIIRILCPLVIAEAQLDKALGVIEEEVAAAAASLVQPQASGARG